MIEDPPQGNSETLEVWLITPTDADSATLGPQEPHPAHPHGHSTVNHIPEVTHICDLIGHLSHLDCPILVYLRP